MAVSLAFEQSLANLVSRLPTRARSVARALEHRVGRDPRLVLISTGRAGSRFLSAALSDAGLACGHELFFSAEGYRRRLRFAADSSWLAVPYLEAGQVAIPHVIHHVRHPLDVISSFRGMGFWNDGYGGPWRAHADRHFARTGDPLRDAMRFWVQWNERCEALASYRFRLEDKDTELPKILEELGYTTLAAALRETFARMGTQKVNARRRVETTLQSLPAGEDREALEELALRYGYTFSA